MKTSALSLPGGKPQHTCSITYPDYLSLGHYIEAISKLTGRITGIVLASEGG